MDHTLSFAEVVEAVDRLSTDEQETLLEIVRRRRAERGRQTVIENVREARREFDEGVCRPTSPDELMNEILS